MGKQPTRYAALLAAAGLCAGALLTGCDGGEKPSPPPTGGGTVAGGPTSASPTGSPTNPTSTGDPTTPGASDPTSTSQPTPTATRTASGKGAPGVPEAARQHTKKGAEAFARHYVGLVNETGLRPRTGVLEPLSSSDCGSCKNFENNVRYLIRHHQHNSGPAVTIRRTVAQFDAEGPTSSWVLTDQNGMSIIGANGQTVDTVEPAREVTLVFHLIWENGQWQVREIKVDRTGVLPS